MNEIIKQIEQNQSKQYIIELKVFNVDQEQLWHEINAAGIDCIFFDSGEECEYPWIILGDNYNLELESPAFKHEQGIKHLNTIIKVITNLNGYFEVSNTFF